MLKQIHNQAGKWSLKCTVLMLFYVGIVSCGEDEAMTPPKIKKFEQSFPILYNATLPEGKLPYPHHHPEYNQDQYDSLVNSLFIINNFGLYQCGDSPEECYFHDGLDFVLKNGTPVFALKAGIIRANIGGNEYYRTLVVEDLDQPGFAWTYTHINDFQNPLGSEVSQGQFLGKIRFKGLEHIHLNRTRLREGGSWENFEDLINVYSDDFFTFIDENPPKIKTPFYFFRNQTDSLFVNEGTMDTINGKVDIVVSMRDPGAYASDYIGTSGYWGDRLAVRNIEYRILREEKELLQKRSFDFRNLEFRFNSDRWRETMTVFKHAHILDIDAGSNNMFHSHYIITNAIEDYIGEIDPKDGDLSWNTLELDSLDQRIYSNGMYTIEVTAYDSNGNSTVKNTEVYVEN